MQIAVVGKEHPDKEDSEAGDIEDSDASDIDDLNSTMYKDLKDKISKKHERFTDLESRAQEEMDFPDEVDTPLEGRASERFLKYRGIKSLKNCNWDPFENLP